MQRIRNLTALVSIVASGILLAGCGSAPPAPTPPSPVVGIPPTPPPLVTPHTPVIEKELMIRDLKVVNSQRSRDSHGKWNIRTLFSNMSPNGGDPSAFVLKWLRTWETPQIVNGFTSAARPTIETLVIKPWVDASGQSGKPDDQVQLDWGKAPFRLLAIVCRTDLAKISPNNVENAGEGRFVFGVLNSTGGALPFTVIFEYRLQADSLGKVRDWAKDWHDLGNLGDFDEQYLQALERITDAYSGRGIAPHRPNGSSLNQLRTDEIALAAPWELREFNLSPVTGDLISATVKQTPDITFNGSPTFAKFINDNETQIVANTLIVPLDFQGQPFLAGSALNPQPVWKAAGINNNQARHIFAMNTCNGCHGPDGHVPEFTQVHVREANQVAELSGFLTGVTFSDPVDGTSITLNDLAARSAILQQQANISATAASRSLIQLLLQRQNRAD